MDAEAFEARYGFPKPPKDHPNVILYCRAGVRSEDATHHFLHAGYKNARNYTGSMLEWSSVNHDEW